MRFIVVVEFASGHDPVTESQRIAAYFVQNNHEYRTLIFGVWLVDAPPATSAQQVLQGIGGSCLQPPDQLFVTEVTANTASV
jgi:hypothetical protein